MRIWTQLYKKKKKKKKPKQVLFTGLFTFLLAYKMDNSLACDMIMPVTSMLYG